jgi:transcriptional regulator with XRE-family HTH domain
MESKPIAKQFGVVVRKLRTNRGMSQEAFADLCGVHRTYMGTIERGEKTVTIETVDKIAKALNIRVSQLFIELEKSE